MSHELVSKKIKLVDLPSLLGVRVEVVKRERYPLDCWFVFQHANSVTRIPVNVKTAALANEKTYRSRAVALAPLLSWISDPDGRIDFIARNLDADQMILDLIYGFRKIVPGRDYYLFEIDLRNGSPSFRSLIACHRLDGLGLALERHKSRDIVNYLPAGKIIGPKFDIAQALGYALLPKPSASRIKTQILAWNLQQEKATLSGGSI